MHCRTKSLRAETVFSSAGAATAPLGSGAAGAGPDGIACKRDFVSSSGVRTPLVRIWQMAADSASRVYAGKLYDRSISSGLSPTGPNTSADVRVIESAHAPELSWVAEAAGMERGPYSGLYISASARALSTAAATTNVGPPFLSTANEVSEKGMTLSVEDSGKSFARAPPTSRGVSGGSSDVNAADTESRLRSLKAPLGCKRTFGRPPFAPIAYPVVARLCALIAAATASLPSEMEVKSTLIAARSSGTGKARLSEGATYPSQSSGASTTAQAELDQAVTDAKAYPDPAFLTVTSAILKSRRARPTAARRPPLELATSFSSLSSPSAVLADGNGGGSMTTSIL
mmetsp:Transcript_9118/g.34365  ORF Transcript_9118/g.34365 Transcript_9118/m.34365 type:complete len:343 (+) Transcript_9118:895-1923(+)